MMKLRPFKPPDKNGKETLTEKQIKNLKKQWGPDAIAKLMELAKEPYSLDEPMLLSDSKGPIFWKDVLADKDPKPNAIFEETFMKEILDEVLGELPLNQREVLRLRYYEHFTLDDVASRFWSQLGLQRPVCRERIRQIEKNALIKAKRIFLRKGINSVSELIPAD